MATRSRRRWWLMAVTAVVVLAVAAFVVVRFVVYRDTTTALAPNTALNRYRASTTLPASSPASDVASSSSPTTAPALRLPQPGVYRYATTGQEHIDALGGTTHAYPPRTTITITADGCGVQARWDVLQERWMSRQLCLGDGGIVTGAYTDFHRFYGQDDRADWTCQPPYVIVPSAATAGTSWTGGCAAGTNQEDTSVTVIGRESVTVGGQMIDGIHVQRVEKDHDQASSALSTTDQWFDPSDGVVLRETESSSSTTSSLIGAVHYDEHYEIDLISLQPQQ